MKRMVLTMTLTMLGCYHTEMNGRPAECQNAAECDDADECTFDYCDLGYCMHRGVCSEPECDEEIHTFALPTQAITIEAATNKDSTILAWQESSTELNRNYVAILPEDTEEIHATRLVTRDDYGTDHVQLAWPGDNPIIFWSQWDGEQSHILMAEFSISENSLTSRRTIYDQHHSSLSKVVYASSGEFGLTWLGWTDSSANPHSFLGRFNLSGELIEAIELSNKYSYAPHLAPTTEGYSMIYTEYDEEDDNATAIIMRKYRYSNGLLDPMRLNLESSYPIASAISIVAGQEVVLWFHQLHHNDIKLLYLSSVENGEEQNTMLLDYPSTGLDTLSLNESQTALVSWCSPALPESPSSIKVLMTDGTSATLILHQQIDNAECRDTKLVNLDGYPTIFWLDAVSNVSYRKFCGL